MNMKNVMLKDIKIGERCVIKRVDVDGNIKKRIQDLGFVQGSVVECILKSPLNDPTAYLVKGTIIALREEVSKNIFVERK